MIDALAVEIVERKALDLVLDTAEYEDVPIGKKGREDAVATVEEQAVPGEIAGPRQPCLREAEEAGVEGRRGSHKERRARHDGSLTRREKEPLSCLSSIPGCPLIR